MRFRKCSCDRYVFFRRFYDCHHVHLAIPYESKYASAILTKCMTSEKYIFTQYLSYDWQKNWK